MKFFVIFLILIGLVGTTFAFESEAPIHLEIIFWEPKQVYDVGDSIKITIRAVNHFFSGNVTVGLIDPATKVIVNEITVHKETEHVSATIEIPVTLSTGTYEIFAKSTIRNQEYHTQTIIQVNNSKSELNVDSKNCNASICILESSWDGTQYVNPGDTYWLKAKIQPKENLYVKIFYFDDTIVQEKIYTPDEHGNVLVKYTSPNNEDSLSFYRIAMMVEGDPSKTAGEIFRIGDTYPTDLIRFLATPNLLNAKIEDRIQIFAESNSRWDNPSPPYSKLTLTLLCPSGKLVHQNQITTNELGQFGDEFTITEKGFYKLILEDQKRKNVHIFPLNHDTRKIITAEGKDFEISFGFNPDEGIEFTIHELEFDQQGKSLTALLENPGASQVRGDIKIPHEFLDGNMTTIVDGNLRTDIEQLHILNYSLTYFPLYPGNHTIQIIGTTAIPEFGFMVTVILLVSMIPIVIASRWKLKL